MTQLRVIMEDIPDSRLVADLTTAFAREHPGIEVDVDAMHYDLMLERVLDSMQNPGAPSGVVIFDNPWTHDWVRGELIRPLDDFIAATQALDWDDFAPALRSAAEMDGRIWGVPFYTWSFGLIYRTDLYEQAGLRPPRTLDELAANAAALTRDGLAGMAMQPKPDYNAAEEWCNYLFASGGRVQDEAGRVVLDSAAARAALRTYAEVFAASAPADSADWTFDDTPRALAEGRAAQMVNCHWWLPVLNDPAGMAGELAGRFALAEIPGGVGILGVWYWAIPRSADPAQAEAAWTFIAWIASRQANGERVARGGSPVRASTMADPEVWRRGSGRAYYETIERMHRAARPLMHGANAEQATLAIGQAVHDVVAGARGVDQAISEAGAEVATLLGDSPG